MEFREYEDTTTPREEAETIITYDVERQAWYFYTNYGPHARKWEDKIIPSAGVNS